MQQKKLMLMQFILVTVSYLKTPTLPVNVKPQASPLLAQVVMLSMPWAAKAPPNLL